MIRITMLPAAIRVLSSAFAVMAVGGMAMSGNWPIEVILVAAVVAGGGYFLAWIIEEGDQPVSK